MCTDTDEWCKIWRAIDLSFQNWHEKYYKFWLQALECLKSCTLMGSLWPKFIIFELKKYREIIFYDTKKWYKIWRKTDLWFEKWHEEFGIFSPAQLAQQCCHNVVTTSLLTLSQRCGTFENESCTDVSFWRCNSFALRRCQDVATTSPQH